MVRTQIQLTEEQARELKEMAAKQGVSMAELIRESVQRLIEERERANKWRRALAIIGKYHGGPGDVSVNHDKYLDEAYL